MKKWNDCMVLCCTWALVSLSGCDHKPGPVEHGDKPDTGAEQKKTEDPEKLFADAFAALWTDGQKCVALDQPLVAYLRAVAQPDTLAHQQRQDFLNHFYQLMEVAHAIPDIGYLEQTRFLKMILSTHNPELAVRFDRGEFRDTLSKLFDGPRDCIRWVDPLVPHAEIPKAEWEKNCADYFAAWVHDYADISRQRHKMADKLEARLVALKDDMIRYGGNPDVESPDGQRRLCEVLRKYHPEVADSMDKVLKIAQEKEVQYAQDAVKRDLTDLYAAEMRFRDQDLEGNGVPDFWTGDVSGLFRLQRDGRCLESIPARLANSDSAPLAAGGPLGALPPKMQDRAGAFGFQAVPLDPDDRPLGMDTDNSGLPWRNREHFAICAYPLKYGRVGRQTYLVTEQGTIWLKDTDGKPLERVPKDPRAEGWEVATEKVGR